MSCDAYTRFDTRDRSSDVINDRKDSITFGGGGIFFFWQQGEDSPLQMRGGSHLQPSVPGDVILALLFCRKNELAFLIQVFCSTCGSTITWIKSDSLERLQVCPWALPIVFSLQILVAFADLRRPIISLSDGVYERGLHSCMLKNCSTQKFALWACERGPANECHDSHVFISYCGKGQNP